MTKENRLRTLIALAALMVLTSLGGAARADGSQRLFVVQRSTNKNVVNYALRLDARGGPHKDEPIGAYWVMHEEGGRRAELTWIEKKLAYGWQVGSEVRADGFVVRLVAFERRPFRIVKLSGGYRALVEIASKPAYLERIFVTTREGGILPKVVSVELFGTDARTGKPAYERIKND